MPLKIDVYSVMRNEIKILPYFLRHYGSFANRILVWEDQSNDGTREMLEAHPKVTILPCNIGILDDCLFSRSLFPQYEQLSRGKADWVMIADADEFIYHPNIMGKLEELGKEGVKKILCDGFSMYSTSFPTTEGQLYEEVKMGWPDKWSRKTTVFQPDVHLRWSQGRHWTISSRSIPNTMGTGFRILHYRHLGEEYFVERNKKNATAMKVEYDRNKRNNLPDGTRGNGHEWMERNIPNLKNVVD